MIYPLVRAHARRLALAYSVTTLGNIAGQLYPLATGLAINGVLSNNFLAIGWLIVCHFIALVPEVTAKMLDTRVFSSVYASLASTLVIESHARGIDPSVITARSSLSREYVTFLERDVPAAILAVIGLSVSLGALLWLNPAVGLSCLALVLPLFIINRWLARKSLTLNSGLNGRLEKEVALLQQGQPRTVRRHFKALAGWRIKLSDAEAKAFGAMEVAVIALFVIALWQLAGAENQQAGYIYAIFAYIWKFVFALDQVPALVQQLAKLKDIGARLQRVDRADNLSGPTPL